ALLFDPVRDLPDGSGAIADENPDLGPPETPAMKSHHKGPMALGFKIALNVLQSRIAALDALGFVPLHFDVEPLLAATGFERDQVIAIRNRFELGNVEFFPDLFSFPVRLTDGCNARQDGTTKQAEDDYIIMVYL